MGCGSFCTVLWSHMCRISKHRTLDAKCLPVHEEPMCLTQITQRSMDSGCVAPNFLDTQSHPVVPTELPHEDLFLATPPDVTEVNQRFPRLDAALAPARRKRAINKSGVFERLHMVEMARTKPGIMARPPVYSALNTMRATFFFRPPPWQTNDVHVHHSLRL